MTSDKTQRDAVNNERFKDIYVHASQEPWVQWYPGIGLKLLRATQETGHWTILVNCSKGSSFPRHEHLGAGEYYVISGKMEVRGGVENGGITAIAGDYGYEPNGVVHDMTNFPEDTTLYFTNFGPIRFIDDDNNTWRRRRGKNQAMSRKVAGPVRVGRSRACPQPCERALLAGWHPSSSKLQARPRPSLKPGRSMATLETRRRTPTPCSVAATPLPRRRGPR